MVELCTFILTDIDSGLTLFSTFMSMELRFYAGPIL